MVKLLIADGNEAFRLALAERLQSQFHVLSCGSGRQALELLTREQPELLALDLMLPELDGITLLEQAQAAGIQPAVLAVSSMATDYICTCAQRVGVRYLIRRPCDLEAVAARLLDLSQTPAAAPDPEAVMRGLLSPLGIGPGLDGCDYCILAFSCLLENPRRSMTKDLYPTIAKAMGQAPKNVERSIRHAIETGWSHGNQKLWQRYFPNTRERPSNAVFLLRMLEEGRQQLE